MRMVLGLLYMAFLFSGCRNKSGYREEELFLDYQLTGEEGSDQVSVLVQFRERNSYGPNVKLQNGSEIRLDGVLLELNNDTRNGPIYIASRPVNEFAGPHQLIFTDSRGKKWKQDLVFRVIALDNSQVLEKAIDSTGFLLTLKASPPIKKLRVLMTDTSYAGREVDRIIHLKGDTLRIKAGDMTGLKPGPIQLELIHFLQRSLAENGHPAGSLTLSYTLRREFQWAGSNAGLQRQ